MCEFEDMDIISRYSRKQAVSDGVLVQVTSYQHKPVMATTQIYDALGRNQLLAIFRQFAFWKDQEEPNLPEEERLFSTIKNGKKVWVCEDTQGYCIMYPEDY
jgi:hypothetical protein